MAQGCYCPKIAALAVYSIARQPSPQLHHLCNIFSSIAFGSCTNSHSFKVKRKYIYTSRYLLTCVRTQLYESTNGENGMNVLLLLLTQRSYL